MNFFCRQRGLSLPELMILLGIVGLLAAVAVPTFLGPSKAQRDDAAIKAQVEQMKAQRETQRLALASLGGEREREPSGEIEQVRREATSLRKQLAQEQEARRREKAEAKEAKEANATERRRLGELGGELQRAKMEIAGLKNQLGEARQNQALAFDEVARHRAGLGSSRTPEQEDSRLGGWLAAGGASALLLAALGAVVARLRKPSNSSSSAF